MSSPDWPEPENKFHTKRRSDFFTCNCRIWLLITYVLLLPGQDMFSIKVSNRNLNNKKKTIIFNFASNLCNYNYVYILKCEKSSNYCQFLLKCHSLCFQGCCLSCLLLYVIQVLHVDRVYKSEAGNVALYILSSTGITIILWYIALN